MPRSPFDYPAEGPADIYALGVPRDAPIEDRMPPPDLRPHPEDRPANPA